MFQFDTPEELFEVGDVLKDVYKRQVVVVWPLTGFAGVAISA